MGLDDKQLKENGGAAQLAEQAAAAERMRTDADSAHRSLLNTAVHKAVGVLWSNESYSRDQAERCLTEFAKSVPLFVGSKWAAVAAGAAFGLDEVRPGDSLHMQSAELVAGAAKGYLTKRTFEVLAGKDWGFAQKGVAMGGASRLIDTALTPSTYLSNGELSIRHGLNQALSNAGDGRAMAADALTFGVAHFVPGAIAGRRFATSSMLAGSLTGASFGFTSGALGELQREWRNNKGVDYSKVLFAAGTEAATMGAAAAAGHGMSQILEAQSKPGVAFEQLSPKLQVKAALRATSPEYLDQTILTRTPEQRAGSYFEMAPQRLKQELYKANWEPFNPLDSQGTPLIGGGARGYRATISGGRLGMTPVENIPETAKLYLIDPKGIGNWSLSTTGASEPATDSVTMIVGPDDSGKPTMWTFHPGDPVRPSILDTARLNNILSDSGIDTASLPANGAARRIAITREQLHKINSQLPADSRMTIAKIENPRNTAFNSTERLAPPR